MVVGRFVMELSSIDEASAETAGVRLMILVLGWVWLSVVGYLGSGDSMEVKLRYKDDSSRADWIHLYRRKTALSYSSIVRTMPWSINYYNRS